MSSLAFNLLQTSICLTLFSLCYWGFFRNVKHYNFRRGYLLFALLSSLLLPWIDLQPWSSIDSRFIYHLNPVTPNLSEGQSVGFNLIWIYWLGVAISLAILTFRFFKLFQLIRKCPRSQEYFENHPLRYTFGLISSSSFFNFLLWDNTQQLAEHQKHMILQHEMAHIRELHSLDSLFLAIAKCLLWFNPLIYWLDKECAFTHELIADRRVVNEKNKSQYLSVLAEKTLAPLVLRGAHQFNTNQTLKRIVMLSNPHKKALGWRSLMLAPLLVAVLYVVGCDQPSTTELNTDQTVEIQTADQQSQDTERTIYTEVDVLPEPQGGMSAFYQELGKNLLYPKQAKELGVEGKVHLQFVVETDGSITNLKVLKGIGAGCDAAALEALSKSQKWNPGKKGGKNVAVQIMLPVMFKLS